MPRTDRDTWSITESVGATALMVAAARAVETSKPEPLINDPFAEPLVRAAGAGFWSQMIDAADQPPEDPELAAASSLLVGHMAVRTKFFDEFFLSTSAAGVRQAVILASGLDSRAYRLDWPEGTTVFELDQPQVIEFKTSTLADLGAQPTAHRVTIPVDLRTDWPAALKNAGFDPTRPSTWSAEGLTPYLPAEAERLLYERIDVLSAPGSAAAVEYIKNIHELPTDRFKKRAERLKELGLDLDIENLFYLQPGRSDATEWFAERGWATETVTNNDLLAKSNLPIPDEAQSQTSNATYLTARKE
jgi:methyltransferase (TIGR00027 family)